jgi:hypothetical protein
MPLIQSFDSFTKLKEIWLGDVYPADFFDHLDIHARDVLGTIIEWTRQDLQIIHHKLEELEVKVRRPKYSNRREDYFSSPDGMLFKPEICPRDSFLTFGNTMIVDTFLDERLADQFPWRYLLTEYTNDAESRVMKNPCRLQLIGANAVKLGQDFFLDTGFDWNVPAEERVSEFQKHIPTLWPDHRCHMLTQGGHCDAGFAVLRPGLLLVSSYFEYYKENFPGWDFISVSKPEFKGHSATHPNAGNGRWYVPDLPMSPNFNNFVLDFAKEWIGNYTETFFEVNCLMVDEKNILVIGSDQDVFEQLDRRGFNVHVLPFRTRGFWDGGLHCITVDIKRQGGINDYFADVP